MNYRVFISFKNSDDGDDTLDRQITEQIYKYLTERDIKTFYSNISLFELGASVYKDAIDDALDEVNVMLVIGSKASYLNSQWCKYEWQTYQQNILSNIVNGTIITYLGDIPISDVPTAIRHYQSFSIDQTSIEDVCNFIINTLEQYADKGEKETIVKTENGENINNDNNISQKERLKSKKSSTYDSTFQGEYKRLKMQGDILLNADMPAVNYVLDKFDSNRKLYILDFGCGYGNVGQDRFKAAENATILGIDISKGAIEKARQINTNPNCFYEVLDVCENSFEEDIETLMNKYDIPSFDVVFGAYILQHIQDPLKALRHLRSCLSNDGYVIFRNSDEGGFISYGDDGLVDKINKKYQQAPSVSDRHCGRKLHHYLEATGYKNIITFPRTVDTSLLDYDERMCLYKVRFAFRTMYFKKALEKDPTNIKLKEDLEWMNFALDKLQEYFGSSSFWYCELLVTAVASKKQLPK